MRSLVSHPDCAPGPIEKVLVELVPTAEGCKARFELHGDIEGIVVPDKQQPERIDNLWKTTCFEIFWQPEGGPFYREFNLSPSSRWAAYDFADFRDRIEDPEVEAIAIASVHSEHLLVLESHIVCDLPAPADVALNAIVEDRDGNIQFWALAFAEGKAEFHSETCRQWRVESGS